MSGKDSTKNVRKRIIGHLCEPRSRDSGQMPVQEQRLWASLLELFPDAGHRALWDLENHQVILATLASAFGTENTTIFKHPTEHVHFFFFFFFGLTVSQIQQT